jgi:hypothetical protein
MTVELGSLVREKWAALLAERFDITQEDPHRVELESPNLDLLVVHDPRGEVEVRAFRPGTDQHNGWSYTGMVGRADVGRLLDIALGEMRADPAILAGDVAYYEAMARDKAATAQAWTEYYARRGPRPGDRHLP